MNKLKRMHFITVLAISVYPLDGVIHYMAASNL